MPLVAKCKDSLLTTSSGYTNYRGILNLVIILLVLSNARAALENLIKYGLLVDPLSWLSVFFSDGSQHWPAINIGLGLGFHTLISLFIEMFLAPPYAHAASGTSPKYVSPLVAQNGGVRQRINRATGDSKVDSATSKLAERHSQASLAPQAGTLLANCLIIVNLVAVIAIPPYIVIKSSSNLPSSLTALAVASLVFLKLVSYHMMNFWCRDLHRPVRDRARTTRSFLRTYTPPSVEFEKLGIIETGPSSFSESSLEKLNLQEPLKHLSASDTSGMSSMDSASSTRSTSPTAGTAVAQNSDSASPTESEKHEAHIIEILTTLYPNNISLSNIVDFMFVPTLCYDLDYARTSKIRTGFLLKRVAEAIILLQLDMALLQQWIVPTLENSLQPFREMRLSLCIERLLKLAIPNHIIWLIWFYLYFHSVLNILAELTRFADREFYRDWWNSESVYYFWSNWNIPVHKWCARHLYVPLISFGLTKCQASTAVFFVSAFFHEYLVSVPLKMFRMWSFMGMLMQLPLARFVSAYFNSSFANVAVWMSLIIGQPLCFLMYYHDYYIINYRVADAA